MILYDWLVTYFLPLFVNPASIPGGVEFFGQWFMVGLTFITVHLFVIVPYKLFLRIVRYRKWGRFD